MNALVTGMIGSLVGLALGLAWLAVRQARAIQAWREAHDSTLAVLDTFRDENRLLRRGRGSPPPGPLRPFAGPIPPVREGGLLDGLDSLDRYHQARTAGVEPE